MGSQYLLNVNVYSIEEAGFNNYKGEPVRIVEWGVSGGFLDNKGSNFVRKETLLDDDKDFPKLGDNGKNCLVFENEVEGSLGFLSISNKGTAFHGQYPDNSSYQKLTPEEYFNLPDLKTAKKILKSISY